MNKLVIKKCKSAEDFAKEFDKATPGAQHVPANTFENVWENGGVVRVGKAFYEIEIKAPKAKKATPKKNG